MTCQIIRLRFKTAVHFGDGALNDAEYTLPAHTVFSALCHEALSLGGAEAIQTLVDAVNAGNLRISDALPFIGNTYYVPKPLSEPRREKTAVSDDPGAKKKFKQLKYIPIADVERFCRGGFTADDAKTSANDFALGFSSSRVLLANANREQSGDPYSVGLFEFRDHAGLYIFAKGGESELKKLADLFCALACSGIGGKRTSGLGSFQTEFAAPADFAALSDCSKSSRVMSLSACMARESDLPGALAGASYMLKRAGGFVASDTYSDTAKRKRDFYDFAAGSVFGKPFQGGVFDVANKGGTHPVWHYAAPVWIGVSA